MLPASEITAIQAVVAGSLDVTVTVQRLPATPVFDAYGHDVGTYTTVGTAQVNVIKPDASELQTYAGIIGSKRALFLRFIPSLSDIQKGDQIVYLGKNWMVHGLRGGQSYTVTDRFLITTIS